MIVNEVLLIDFSHGIRYIIYDRTLTSTHTSVDHLPTPTTG
jgi:hypothetical protein